MSDQLVYPLQGQPVCLVSEPLLLLPLARDSAEGINARMDFVVLSSIESLDLPGFMTHPFSLAVSSYLLLHQSAKRCKPNFIEPLALSGELSDLMSNPSATSLPWS